MSDMDLHDEWAGWTDQQLLDYEEYLYDREREGEDNWAQRDAVICLEKSFGFHAVNNHRPEISGGSIFRHSQTVRRGAVEKGAVIVAQSREIKGIAAKILR